MEKWTEQYERTLRWAERIKIYYKGFDLNTPLNANHIRDDLLVFFQSAHHMKHWIGNDRSNTISEQQIQQEIDKEDELKLCMDLCNGYKHLVYNNRRSKLDPKLGGGNLYLNVGGSDQGLGLKSYNIELSDGSTIEAKELMEKILNAWEEIFKKFNLK